VPTENISVCDYHYVALLMTLLLLINDSKPLKEQMSGIESKLYSRCSSPACKCLPL